MIGRISFRTLLKRVLVLTHVALEDIALVGNWLYLVMFPLRFQSIVDSDSDFEVFELFDPAATGKVVGRISLSCSVEDPMETEKNFARCILAIVDYNEDGKLSFSEFSDLIKAFGNQVADNKKEELFKAADKNGDDAVSMDELAELLAFQQENEPLINCCPVCGEILEVSDKLNTLVHLSLCFDEGTGNQVMTGGFLTDKQASYGWMFKLSEWAHFSSYDVGLNSGSSASHILVFDRKTKRLVEELIDKKIVLSMRAIYQSKIGLRLMDKARDRTLPYGLSFSSFLTNRFVHVMDCQICPSWLQIFQNLDGVWFMESEGKVSQE
ncbi:hypothetical protein POTOM_004953 [Populus tomentosa]|uniref:EF-hand domain-containing protein n=1 Tax=Populus tomentosa TaxID=118781 RepID=A0A8X8AW06_POPTO|nr:hypothetical protein POTOM_004953 [Populus tomentosa]